MDDLSGNIGEWSEIYAFLKLLREGKIHAANDDLDRIENMYLPIIKIQREEVEGQQYDYHTGDNIQITLNGQYLSSFQSNQLDNAINILFQALLALRRKRTGKVKNPTMSQEETGIKAFLQDLFINKIKANSNQKTDITIQIIDIHTGFSPLVGFSIKSQLGAPSTLLNASGATNLIFKITGMNDVLMDEINAITGDKKVLRRFTEIYNSVSNVQFIRVDNQDFTNNLEMIDSLMPEILAYMLVYKYRDNITNIQEIVTLLMQDNPLNYHNPKIYRYKIKKLLSAIALGMRPGTEWDGIDEANGGYIIVKSNGDILAYYLYNRNAFEDYLLKNTFLETGGTNKHKFAEIYKMDGEYFIKMNAQIRFKA